jgi:small subunit ribosomal protein S3
LSSIKHFIEESIRKTGVDEFLWKEFERAGYGGVDITKTPLGTNIVVYAMRPGIIIGRGGTTIKNLALSLEAKFGLPNPQVSVAEIEVPELNAHVMASRIASTLQRGVHFRRAGFWALTQIMEAGALGAEIIVSGKLRTERARKEKFREGYVPKSGEPSIKYVRRAVVHTQMKPGIFGIRVSIMPPGIEFPDQVKIIEIEPEPQPPKEIIETPQETSEEIPEEQPEKIEEVAQGQEEQLEDEASSEETSEVEIKPQKKESKA